MQLWSNINTLWLLCLNSMLGIIGMLVVDVIWDIVLLIVTADPRQYRGQSIPLNS